MRLLLLNFFKPVLKPNKLAYNKLISLKQTIPSGSKSKWIVDCNLEFQQSINWNAVYETPFCCRKASKLIVFQFKLLHRRLATNDYLHKIGLKNDDTCTFCKNGKESLAHLFWPIAGRAILSGEDFKTYIYLQGIKQVTIKEKNYSIGLVLGIKIDVFSHLQHYFYFLVARYFIWTCKMKEIIPSINNFPIFLQHFCDLEYDEKKKNLNLSKIDSLGSVGNLVNYINYIKCCNVRRVILCRLYACYLFAVFFFQCT